MASLYEVINYIVGQSKEFENDVRKIEFIKLLKKCHRIKYTFIEDLNIKIGFSKIGGKPDLPKGVNWPTYKNNYLTFLCQIKLSDLDNTLLPKEGMLYFFVYADPESSYKGSRDSFKIIYHQAEKNLYRNEYPVELDVRSKFSPSQMFFHDSISYPDDESPLIKDLFNNWDDKIKFYSKLDNLMEQCYKNQSFEDKILGYDSALQSSAEHFWPINYLNIKT